jgi:hypothetical protein
MDTDFDPNKLIDELLSADKTDARDIESAVRIRSSLAKVGSGGVSGTSRGSESSVADDLKVDTAYKFFKIRSAV